MPDYDVVKIDPNAAPENNTIPPSNDDPEAANNSKKLWLVSGGIIFIFLFLCAGGILFVSSRASADDSTPTPFIPPTLQFATITHSERPTATVTIAPPTETPDIERTATFVAAINRPAAAEPSDNYRILVGPVVLEPGCNVTNLGFNASGVRYYLHMPPSLVVTVNPDLQLAEVRGVITHVDTCIYPLIQVQSFVWLNEVATPAPLFAPTTTITDTVWRDPATPIHTPAVIRYIPPQPTPITTTVTPYPTYTPYPTPHPVTTYIPEPRQWPTPQPLPTYTVYPTFTPYPTLTTYPTFTPPPTYTPTSTATPTYTPTLTPTLTSTPALTTTNTPTSTPLPTNTPTQTPGPTVTATAIITP